MSFKVPEHFRWKDAPAPYASDDSFGNNGVFIFDLKNLEHPLKVIAFGW